MIHHQIANNMKTGIPIQSKWFLLFTVLLLGYALQAQDKWSFSIKSGMGIPTHDLGNTDIKPGFGYEGVLGFQFSNNFSAYAGWSHQLFPADDLFAGQALDFEETGYTIGIQFTYPAEAHEVHYSLSAGILYNHIEAENADGDIVGDSGHELGAQLEALIAIPLSNTLYLIPYVRYRTLDTDITIDEVTTPTVLTYIGVGTGVKWTF